MHITDEMINTAKAVAEELWDEYEKVGIRVQDCPFTLGAMDHVSHVWIDGVDTGEGLPGVCALDLSSSNLWHEYFGQHVAIIAGNEYSYGDDPGEIILHDAEVVRILS